MFFQVVRLWLEKIVPKGKACGKIKKHKECQLHFLRYHMLSY